MKNKIITILFILVLALNPTKCFANTEAENVIKETIHEIKELVKNTDDSVSDAELESKLRTAVGPAFDFREMSRRSLGPNWRNASEEEQKEFTELFSELLAKSYTKQIRENAKDSEFNIVSSRQEGRRSFVQTIVKTPKEDVKIDYRLYSKDNEWKVYDVIIENIGLVSNYRSEFAGIVRRHGISGLIEQLKEKTGK